MSIFVFFIYNRINQLYYFFFFSVENDDAAESPSGSTDPIENSGLGSVKNPAPANPSASAMVDSGVDSEASSPDSGPPRPDLLLETAETLLALSGKSRAAGIQNSSPASASASASASKKGTKFYLIKEINK